LQIIDKSILNKNYSVVLKESTDKELEGKLTKKVIQWLNSLPESYCMKRQATAGRRGQVDITGCIKGRRIEIEMKVGNNKPTKIQEKWIKTWREAGAIAGCCWSLNDVKHLISQHGLINME